MTTQSSSLRRFARPLIVLFALSAAFQACKGENATPDDDDVVNPGGERNDDGAGGRRASGGSGTNTGGRKASGGSRNEGGEGNAPQGTGGTAPLPEREDCPDEPNGDECWDLSACNGIQSIQFLEQCDGECLFGAFDNTKIEGFSGTLPPLP